ncbi:829_t:CDS:2 [Diversispora eburnea]|uniref:829_t:CDS:1 n=1 Tax=Diversispora eburnea TaxID=1213867 RepID=A0A9N9B5H5_9GLOM|nr:829_t:CDS:2 [Diversispora eburnea]
MSYYPTLIKILNLVAYLFLAVFVTEPEFRFENHDIIILPYSYVFYIWNLIHWLLSIFLVYQFIDTANDIIVKGISWRFVCVAILNVIWLMLVVTERLGLALITILIVAYQLSFIYHNLKVNYPPQNRFDAVFIHLPFNLYQPWILIIVIINTFAAFLPDKPDKGDENQDIETYIIVLGVISLIILNVITIFYQRIYQDLIAASVITIVLYGIAIQQSEVEIIYWSSIILAIMNTIGIFSTYLRKRMRQRMEEGAPLLG